MGRGANLAKRHALLSHQKGLLQHGTTLAETHPHISTELITSQQTTLTQRWKPLTSPQNAAFGRIKYLHRQGDLRFDSHGFPTKSAGISNTTWTALRNKGYIDPFGKPLAPGPQTRRQYLKLQQIIQSQVKSQLDRQHRTTGQVGPTSLHDVYGTQPHTTTSIKDIVATLNAQANRKAKNRDRKL